MKPMLLNNRYRLMEMVGAGGMAVVYRGVDALLHRKVAVKVLREAYASDPSFLARFQREAQAAASLDHPNIVTVHDVGQDGDQHYIVMEYVDGQDLKTLIRQSGHLEVSQSLDIARQICAGVGHAHRCGVIHCDLKPQNVLVTHDGRAKVTDFGIARALSESDLTESEVVWGSPLYFSPEQAAGEPPTPASDVYSVGIIMYEMLTGNPPFQAEKATTLALMHMREEPPPLALRNPQVPPRLEWIIRKVLSKEPAARYRTAEQLAHVLEEYQRHGEQETGEYSTVLQGNFTSPTSEPAPPLTTPESKLLQPQLAPSRHVSTWPPGISGSTGLPAEDSISTVTVSSMSNLTWFLAIIAFVAVVGLVPLWSLVYRAYTGSTGPPGTLTPDPSTTLTAQAAPVPMPRLVGKSLDEAQAMLDSLELGYTVTVEEGPTSTDGTVLEQIPAPNQLVSPDSQVTLVVSGPGRELTMPGVVGYPVDMVRSGLESDGFKVNVEETWSTELEGTILEQVPEAGTTVHAGDALTLTVSGGVSTPIPIDANLANFATLKNAELRQRIVHPGDIIAITLRWQSLQKVDTHYVVFVHLLGPDGQLAAQQDTEPVVPTTSWIPGVDFVDPHQVKTSDNLPQGQYQLRVGMYPQGQPGSRVEVVDSGETTAESNSILIAQIEIQSEN